MANELYMFIKLFHRKKKIYIYQEIYLMLVRDSFINDHHEHDTRSRGEVSLNPNRLELYTKKQKFV